SDSRAEGEPQRSEPALRRVRRIFPSRAVHGGILITSSHTLAPPNKGGPNGETTLCLALWTSATNRSASGVFLGQLDAVDLTVKFDGHRFVKAEVLVIAGFLSSGEAEVFVAQLG